MNKSAQHEHGDGHVVPISVYLIVYVALLVLLVATIAVSQVHLGPLNNVVAVGIAVIKAVLVVLFFMGVKYGTKLTWVWAAAGFLWLAILFGTLGDYVSRNWVLIKGW